MSITKWKQDRLSQLRDFAKDSGVEYRDVFKNYLPEEIAKATDEQNIPLQNADRVIRKFDLKDCDFDNLPQIAKTFLEVYTSSKNNNPQFFVEDPMVNGVVLPGRYRCSSVYISDKNSRTLVQELRRGFATSLDLTECRILASNHVPTEEEPTGVTKNAKDPKAGGHVYQCILPNISPASSVTVQESFAGTYTGPKIGYTQLTGKWYVLRKTPKEQDDGSVSIEFTLAQPQHTLYAFSDYGGANATENTVMYSVPIAVAQSVIDYQRGTDGTTVNIAGLDTTNGLVNLTMSTSASGVTVTVTAYQITCDTSVVLKYGFGIAKDDIDTWITTNASGVLGSGLTRQVRVSMRGDGLFNIECIETTFTFDVDKHTFQFTWLITDVFSRLYEYGWKLPKVKPGSGDASYGGVDVVKTRLEALAGKNVDIDFRITREDDCTFDYQAVVITHSELDSTLIEQADPVAPALSGVKIGAQALTRVDASDITTALGAATPRKNVQLRIDQDPLGKLNAVIVNREVPEVEDNAEVAQSGNVGAKKGIGVKVYSGNDLDVGALQEMITTGGIAASETRLVDLSLETKEGNVTAYRATVRDVASSTEEETLGEYTISTGRNQTDTTGLPSVFNESEVQDKFVQAIDLDLNDAGAISWRVLLKALVSETIEITDEQVVLGSDTNINTSKITFQKNVDPVSDTIEVVGYLDSASISRGEGGKYDAVIREKIKNAWNTNESITFTFSRIRPRLKASGYSTAAIPFENVSFADLPVLGATEFGEYVQLDWDDRGLWTGTLLKYTYFGSTSSTYNALDWGGGSSGTFTRKQKVILNSGTTLSEYEITYSYSWEKFSSYKSAYDYAMTGYEANGVGVHVIGLVDEQVALGVKCTAVTKGAVT